MLNFNGKLISKNKTKISTYNRGFRYGDALFETLKSENLYIYFMEDHYFRLVSSMRMLRMNIPDNFTLEYFNEQVLKTLKINKLDKNARIRFTVFRQDGGLYLPITKNINFLIEVENFELDKFSDYQIDLYKDFPILSGSLSNIKTNNRIVNVMASIFADENDYKNCILLNEKKNIVEVINANIFLVFGNTIKTPDLNEGCINGIIRKKIIEAVKQDSIYYLEETSIAPIELLRADEVFITNSIIDIQNVSNYRKKKYTTKVTLRLREMLQNIAKVNLS